MSIINTDSKVFRFVEVDSTNRIALSSEGAQHGSVFVAKRQNTGIGRRGRQWVSPMGGLYLSILLENLEGLISYQKCSILCGLCVARVCGSLAPDESFYIKWPNDIFVRNKKLCGILAQIQVKGNTSRGAIGIGVNLNAESNAFPEDLRDKVISLKDLTHSEIDIDSFETLLLTEIDRILDLDINASFLKQLELINDILYGKGFSCPFLIGGIQTPLVIEGVDSECKLVAIDSHGQPVRISIAEFL